MIIINYKESLNKFNNSLCLVVRLLCFIISEFFILFNVFRFFLASISLIVLFLILLTKSLMSIYLNSPILFLQLNLLLSIIAEISLNLFLSKQSVVFLSFSKLFISMGFFIDYLILTSIYSLILTSMLVFFSCSFSFFNFFFFFLSTFYFSTFFFSSFYSSTFYFHIFFF